MSDLHQLIENINLSSPEEEWIDMLPVLNQASESMYLGELIHSNEFHLELATHALEIMNPKLDPRSSGDHIYTPEQLYQKGEIPEDSTLSNLQILKIIDKLICYEVSWIEGDPLALTLFSCMYLHIAEQLKNQYFSLYINTLLISCDAINVIVSRGDICCEEDFNLSNHGLNLINFKNDSASKILPNLEILEMKFSELIKDETNQESIKVLKSLLNRLTFRRLFYSIVLNLSQNYCQTANKLIREIQPVLEYLKNDCYIRDDIVLPDSIFNSNLVLKLFANVGGRSEEKPFPDSIKAFEKFFTDLSTLFQMPHILESSLEFQKQRQLEKQQLESLSSNKKGNKSSSINKPQPFDILSIIDYLFYFSKFSPSIITRSILRRLLFPFPSNTFFKNESLLESLYEWMNEFGIPYLVLQSSKAKEQISIFMNNLTQVLFKLFTYLALNRARQRRKLKFSIYELSFLQTEADILDSIITSNTKLYFGSFIFNLKLRVVEHFLFLGFELEVYAPHEFYQVYYYLDYLMGIHSNIFTYIFRANHPEKQINSKKASQQQQLLQQQQHQPTPTCERILLTANHLMVRAIFRFLVILKNYGKIKSLSSEFSTDELRFMKKFEPFFNPPNQQPDPLPMERVRDSSETDEPWLSIAMTTLDILNQAKMAVETIKNHKNKIGKVTQYQDDEAAQLRIAILRLSLTIKKLLPSNFESLTPSQILNYPIPKFSIQIQTQQYFPNFIINLE